MAGRTPNEAREAFHAPLRRVLDCLTPAQLLYVTAAPGETEALTMSEQPARIPTVQGTVFRLFVEQRYALVRADDDERGPWRASTGAYRYRVDDADGRELASWHWHPTGRSRYPDPHVHVTDGPLAGLHLPAGRVGLEEVILLLLSELGTRPRRDDWRQVIDEALTRFRQWRMWA